jgi:type IV secretory pathway VirB9-like protein
MKTISILLISSGLAVGAVTTSHAATSPDAFHVLLPSAPRTVVVRETETPPLIRAGLLQSTLILLPPEEKVATVFGGDTVSWVFDGGHVASRFISIKPKVANTTTDVHIVSDHGNEYTLQLKEISTDGDPHFDSKVFVTPGDQAGKDKLAAMPVFVPAAELDKAKREAQEAEAQVANERKAEAAKAEQYRSQYPGELHFDYTWDQKKGTELGLQQVWRDDKFTYLRGHFQETPALYELKDGKGSLINFDFNDGLYTIPKSLSDGYLTIGKKRVEFKRTGGN